MIAVVSLLVTLTRTLALLVPHWLNLSHSSTNSREPWLPTRPACPRIQRHLHDRYGQ